MNKSVLRNLLKNKIYHKYIRISAVLLIALFFINCIGMGMTIKKARSQNIENSRLDIKNKQLQISTALSNVEQCAQELALDNGLNNFKYSANNPQAVVERVNDIKPFGMHKGIKDFIATVYIYIPKQDIVISQDGKFTAREYYGMSIKQTGESFENWSERIGGVYFDNFENEHSYFNGQRILETIEYKQSYPFGANPAGTIVIVIDYNAFNRFCGNVDLGDKSLFVVDKKDKVIYRAGSEKHELRREYIDMDANAVSKMMSPTVVFKSENDGYKFISVEQSNELNRNLGGILLFDFVCILVFLFVGFLICFYMAYNASDPLMKLEKVITRYGEDSPDGDFESMYKKIVGAFESNQVAEKLIENQKESVKNNALRKLLHNQGDAVKTVFYDLKELGVTFENDLFMIAEISIESGKNIDTNTAILINEMIKHQILAKFENVCRFELIEDNIEELIIIFNMKRHDTESEIISLLSELDDMIIMDYGVSAYIDVGGVHGRDKIYCSYYEIKECKEYRMYSGTGRVLQYSKLKNSRSNYFYNSEKENELIRYVVMGNAQSALQCFDEMITLHNDCSLIVLKCLYFNLLGTMFKILDSGNVAIAEEIEKKYDFNVLLQCKDMVGLENEIRSMIQSICDDIKASTMEKKNNLTRAILVYIGDNYQNNAMSLEMLADEFKLNYTYVSHFFKEQIGETFGNYITRLRIDKAKKLLLETNKSIGEIAENVGYTNSTVFIRNFKKLEGMPPGQYRENTE